MTALDDFIENLAQNVTAPGNQPVVCTVDLFIAAMQLVQTSIAAGQPANLFGAGAPVAAGLPGQMYFDTTASYKAYIYNSAAWNAVSTSAAAAGTSAVTNGRLTLVTGTPVLITDVTAITTVFFALYNGDKTLINQGAGVFAAVTHGELSQTLADNTKSPAAAAANSLYDLFVWEDAAPGGTVRCTRGPAWTNATTRALALTRINGILVNDTAITNGPGANLGTYVGTIATDATPDLNMMFNPAAAAGGSNNRLDVWNMYNRVKVTSINRDSTANWAYKGTAFRPKDNNTNNSITFVVGVSEDALDALNIANDNISATTSVAMISIGLDSSTVKDANALQSASQPTGGGAGYLESSLRTIAPLGRHFVCPLEQGTNGVGNVTWNGPGGVGYEHVNGISLTLPM